MASEPQDESRRSVLWRFDLFLGDLHVMEYPSGRYLEGEEERYALDALALHPSVEAASLRTHRAG